MQRILEIDARLSARLRVAEKPGILRTLAILFGHSGDSWFWLAAMAIIAFVNFGERRLWALIFIFAILATAFLVMAIKFTVRRQRPEGEWGQLYRRTDPHSFPSGHAARAMMLAVLALGMGPAWFAYTLILWAPLVGIARVATGLHYVSDVLVGWIFGAIAGFLILEYLPEISSILLF